MTGFPYHDGPECLIYRKDLFADEELRRRYASEFDTTLRPSIAAIINRLVRDTAVSRERVESVIERADAEVRDLISSPAQKQE